MSLKLNVEKAQNGGIAIDQGILKIQSTTIHCCLETYINNELLNNDKLNILFNQKSYLNLCNFLIQLHAFLKPQQSYKKRINLVITCNL